MPKRPDDPEQLCLIDVDDPKFKPLKKQLQEYDALLEENKEVHAANRVAERQKRQKVFEAAQAANLSPDTNGVYHIKIGEMIWHVSQEAQLKITKSKAPKAENPGAAA